MKMNDIYDEGFDSFFDGETENPYSVGDIRYHVWSLGYDNAKNGK